ncbi:mechanosensitive ion channel family protein [Exiguobacterium acetylicum]|uniref:mechanosensitive ion channel family protein n=1 Tax=Exiguobacterium acetylicum TaxID=41170 RepID=UPI000A7140D7|nr:hypothetical protein [Exiguobacterium acetylicum]
MNNIWNGTSLNLNGILGSLGNLLGAIIVFLIGWLIAKLIAKRNSKSVREVWGRQQVAPQKEVHHQRRRSGHLKKSSGPSSFGFSWCLFSSCLQHP